VATSFDKGYILTENLIRLEVKLNL